MTLLLNGERVATGRVDSVTLTAGTDALDPTEDELLQAVLVTQ